MAAPTDYASLQDQVARWSGGSSDDFFPEAVRDAIGLAENDLDHLLWVPERVKRVFVEYRNEYEGLPVDIAALILIRQLNDQGRELARLRREPAEAMPGIAASYAGQLPLAYAQVGAQVQLAPAPTPEQPLRARLIYYGLVPRLSDAASCTAVLLTYGDAYLYTALKHLAAFTDDAEGIAKWEGLSLKAITAANLMATARESDFG